MRAKQKNPGEVGVLFVIDLVGEKLNHKEYVRSCCAYLKGDEYSMYPSEDEVLIG